MERTHFDARGYKLQPRVPIRRSVNAGPAVTSKGSSFMSRILRRSDDDDCSNTSSANSCEKPSSGSNSIVIPVVIGVVILAILACLLFYLHKRNMRRQRDEELKDPHKSLDFGLTEEGARKKGTRKSLMFGGEKGLTHKQSQLSMDMNLSSPYLLPPGLQQSRESLNSLARSLGPDTQDPYRPVAELTRSETGSSKSPIDEKKRISVMTGRSQPPRQNSLPPKTPVTPSEKVDPFATPTVPEATHQMPSPRDRDELNFPIKPVVPEIGVVSYSDSRDLTSGPKIPDIQVPPATKSPIQGLPSPSAAPPQIELPPIPQSAKTKGAQSADNELHMSTAQQSEVGLGLDFDFPKPASAAYDAPLSAPIRDGHDFHAYQPEIRTSEYEDEEDDARGRSAHRRGSGEVEPQQGLGVPQQNNKRLSVGFRPLPPDDIAESEDPEYRANRIRSFYKEYFGESEEPPPPMPAPPKNLGQKGGNNGPAYYEDYDNGYLAQEAAYFDPETNAFVMPYAEPVTRRAMTPPPAGRFRPGPSGPGPRGPGPRPRGPHGPSGSIGGMSAPGGPRGRPRAGSAFGPRSSPMSSRAPSSLGPRPDSSASARINRPQPKKMGPPPAALTTLPTPSKLRDDNIALLGAIDFAPPDTIKDTAAGRSSSPVGGERRPYQPKVPVASPLVTAFDELAALPSPHLLRKSGTFTALDFAAPKKFQNEDSMSDAGSIRSNRSGISQKQLGAIRNGAGRVSRLPGDTVFTTGAGGDQLKPQWGMRP